jgi:hypothetical protein
MQELVEQSYPSLRISQDLGLGMMLWLSHFFPREPWALEQPARALATLESMWLDPPGYFCREPGSPHVKFAFTNYGVSLGLQAVVAHVDRVSRLNALFATAQVTATTPMLLLTSWDARRICPATSCKRRRRNRYRPSPHDTSRANCLICSSHSRVSSSTRVSFASRQVAAVT